MWYTLTLVVGIILLVISIFKCRETLAFLKNSERTVGKLVDCVDGDSHAGDCCRRWISFGVIRAEVNYLAVK
jgi:hypothetical protein